ncbi:hypothetical protein JYT86_00845 [bacterium AH-315-N03]|nr:hypothetical protein [bacterium AH-315-N03]
MDAWLSEHGEVLDVAGGVAKRRPTLAKVPRPVSNATSAAVLVDLLALLGAGGVLISQRGGDATVERFNGISLVFTPDGDFDEVIRGLRRELDAVAAEDAIGSFQAMLRGCADAFREGERREAGYARALEERVWPLWAWSGRGRVIHAYRGPKYSYAICGNGDIEGRAADLDGVHLSAENLARPQCKICSRNVARTSTEEARAAARFMVKL